MPTCELCGKVIKNDENLERHRKTHTADRPHPCAQCPSTFKRKDDLSRHRKRVHGPKSKIPRQSTPADAVHVISHQNVNAGASNSSRIADSGKQAQSVDAVSNQPLVDERLSAVIRQNMHLIETYKTVTRRIRDTYNFQLRTASRAEFEGFLAEIWKHQKYACKINIALGFILQNIYTDELVYYYASSNTRIFESPKLVQDDADMTAMLEDIDSTDLLEYCRQQRPNTKYMVRMLTNALFFVNKIKKFRIGCCGELPDFIRRRRSLINFEFDRNMRRYDDKLCFFRCLAYHFDDSYAGLTRRAKNLLHRHFGNEIRSNSFNGVCMDDLVDLENTFEINIEVYKLSQEDPEDGTTEDEDDENPGPGLIEVATKVFSSRHRYNGEPLRLNLYRNHFSLISNFGAYVRRWACIKCHRLFDRAHNMKVHERNCSKCTKVKFPGGGYGAKKNLFEKLAENGILVPEQERYFPHRIAFDFESVNRPIPLDNQREGVKEKILAELEPVSVSICSNVAGYTMPKCFISAGNPSELISEMYGYMTEISSRSREILTEQFGHIIDELNYCVAQRSSIGDRMDMLDDEAADGQFAELQEDFDRMEVFEMLSKEFDVWISRIVCLGFNTGKFDINLVRKYLFPYFLTNNIDIDHIIKRNNDYLCIATPHVLFLDIKNYLAAGISYDKWLKSSGVEQTKSVFPYDWFTDLSKLEERRLPPIESFWSNLRQTGITEDQYCELQRIWDENGFQSMRDFLVYYNNLDVAPFITAAEKLYRYWTSLGIDPFKSQAISLPGLALGYLVKEMTPHTILPIFDSGNKDIYYAIRQNIVGGLSIVMHRYHEQHVTTLPNGQMAKIIYSFDCNSLYLWALGQPTGTGFMTVWRSDDTAHESMPWKVQRDPERLLEQKWHEILHRNMDCTFTRQRAFKGSISEVEWLEWESHARGVSIEHKFNGRSKTIIYSRTRRYPVDGFIPASGTILQFHGCYWHGHGCELDSNDNPEISATLRVRTREITGRLRSLGYIVEEKWECQWRQEKQDNPAIQNFLNYHLLNSDAPFSMSGADMMRKIENGELFGLLECDLEVPPWDTEGLAWYEEFPPICKNVEISRSDIKDHMLDYANERGYMRTPRKNLINSYWARKILLTTPIVRWLVHNRVKVTRIYQFIQMKPKACFEKIPGKIAQHRRDADQDPSRSAAGESWKTLGNSLYGKAMTNKERHKEHSVVHDDFVSERVNDQRFHKLEEVGDLAYEVTMDKKSVTMDLPLTVAVFVYNYAKLRMLEFVYDFMKKYLRPGSYQMVCSDTDSIIAAYESDNIDDLVKPELKHEYLSHGKHKFLAYDRYSSRTPGLFKEELRATGIVSLCSKTYFAWNDEDQSTKVSTKGLSKKTNQHTKETFLNVLRTKNKGKGTNYGFRVVNDSLYQYEQEREALAYLYVKRRVHDDGISTSALHL